MFDPVTGVDVTFVKADVLVAFELPEGFNPETHRMVSVAPLDLAVGC